MKRLVVFLTLFLFLSPVFAHITEPDPTPTPSPVLPASQTTSHSHDYVIPIALVVVLIAVVVRAVYCHLYNDCAPEETKPADPEPLTVAPDTDQVKVRLYQ